MYPVLFEVGGFELRAYGFLFGLSFIAALVFGLIRAKKYKITGDEVYEFAFYIIFSSLAGAKLLSLIVDFKYIIQQGLTIDLLRSGFVFMGGLVGGICGGFAYVIVNKKDYRKFMDFVAPIVPLAHAIGRVGCFLNGCCYGKATDTCGIVFPNLGDGLKRYPTQLFESFFLVFITIFTVWFDKKKKYNSQLFVIYIGLYSIFRFINEFFRGDYRGSVFNISTSQIVSVIMFIVIIIYDFKARKKNG
ncbi:MAG: prolipoprotein diacylglyceryl transferase [Candidatus Muiribacteriota bacterium]